VHNPSPMHSGISLTWRFSRVVAFAGFAVLAASVALAGCGSTDDRPPTWSYIYPAIIEPSCATASCHSDIVRRSGVDLGSKSVAYDQLTMRHFVIPTVPADSEIVHLMRAEGARRMPPDFALPEVDIQLIEAWIMAGAKEIE
jgi:hypothetical protein